MAESWVRLWAGTTTDPKWQTIARKSGQPRALVIAMFMHMLMVANEALPRGSVRGMSIEDAASALDCDEDQVADILHAMEGRVVEPDGMLSGWSRRQPSREDSGNEETGAMSSTERSRLHRERKRLEAQGNGDATQCNDAQRAATQCNAPEAEADTEAEVNPTSEVACSSAPEALPETGAAQPAPTRKGIVCGLLRKAGMADAAPHYLTDEVWETILAKRTDEEIVELARAKMAARPGQRTGLKYIAPALLDDPEPIEPSARGSPPADCRRRQTLTETRAQTLAALTGRNRNHERPIADERDITAESQRIE